MKAGRGWTGMAVLAAAVALGGCVSLPTGGPADSSNGANHGLNSIPNTDLSQDGIVVNPVPPGSQWQPAEIVSGFLDASGADRGIARQYLTPGYSSSWKPDQAAMVIDTNPAVIGGPLSSHVTGGPQTGQVTVTSDHLEKLVPTGSHEAFRLETATGSGPYTFHFGLSQISGKWRINRIFGADGVSSEKILLISNADFVRDYQPRNLYFPINPKALKLVPYPVYIPDRSGNKGIMTLVEALTTQPPSSTWLYSAVSTGFPPGTKVLKVQLHGNAALITLGGAAAKADSQALQQMEAQLVTTLTYSPYSPDTSETGIREVELQIRNFSIQLLPTEFRSWVPSGSTSPLYFQSGTTSGQPPRFTQVKAAAVGVSRGAAEKGSAPVVLPGGLGFGPMNAIAISPAGVFPPTTFAGCRGKQVYVVPLFGDAPLIQGLPGNCSSLSWDTQGRLWVTSGTDVFVLTESPTASTGTGLQVTPVSIPAPQIPSADTFSSLKVAPDGVRVAMIVHGKSGSTVYVTSTTVGKKSSQLIYLAQSGQLQPVGPDLDNPVDLTWWGPDHLLVLDQRHAIDQLYEVPLNGGQSVRVPTPPGVTSVTGDGSVVVVGIKETEGGTTRELIESASGLDGIWHRVAPGTVPTYAG
jgi:Lipoprotein LpqB beta-propeller domain/Sporulation and spore germination